MVPFDRMSELLRRLDCFLARAERVALVGILFAMVGLSTLQLVLSKTINFRFEWADILVRQMVLWLGFVGGALAAHEGRHIAIDALCKFLPARKAGWVRAFTSLGAACVAGVLAYAAVLFVEGEIEDGSKLFGTVQIWPFELVLVVSFLLVAFHFLVATKGHLDVGLGRRAPDERTDA